MPLRRAFWLAVVAFSSLRADDAAALRPWPHYQVILWIGDSAGRKPELLPLFFRRLREMGVTAGMIHHDGDPAPFLAAGMPYYLENVVNRGLCLKFNSKVADWDRMVSSWAKQGRGADAFIRDYQLNDPQWRDEAGREVARVAAKHRPNAPLMLCLRDELSTTLSANPFDFDFHPAALADFRRWLRSQYSDLAALNAEWETQFARWDDVRPFSTDQIKNRMGSGEAAPRGNPDWQAVQALRFDPAAALQSPTRWNFAPWADFRSYMDTALVDALGALRGAARAADPALPVGIEGTQMPSAWGGYDLWRLSQALDWVEPYDIGCAREIFGSFMPGKPLLTTVGEADAAHARRRLWHLLLEGDRGCLVWWSEDCIQWADPQYALTPRARALAPVFGEMTSPLASLFLRAQRERDPVFLIYSQPSIQADWLLESTVDGSTWVRRFSSYEASHNRLIRARSAWLKLFQDLGYSPQFLPAERLADKPWGDGPATVVLPEALALSRTQLAGLQELFSTRPAATARALFGDGPIGIFDEHVRLRPHAPYDWTPLAAAADGALARWAGPGARWAPNSAIRRADIAAYASERLRPTAASEWTAWAQAAMAGLPQPPVTIAVDLRVRTHRFRLGAARLLAFERNIEYQMSEDLTQAGGNEALEKPARVSASWTGPAWVYDLRTGQSLGRIDRMTFALDPWEPALFALLDAPLGPGDIVGQLASRNPL